MDMEIDAEERGATQNPGSWMPSTENAHSRRERSETVRAADAAMK